MTWLTLWSRPGRGRREEQAEDPGQWFWTHLWSILPKLFSQVIMFLAYFIGRKNSCDLELKSLKVKFTGKGAKGRVPKKIRGKVWSFTKLPRTQFNVVFVNF